MYKAMIANATGEPIKEENSTGMLIFMIMIVGAIGYIVMNGGV